MALPRMDEYQTVVQHPELVFSDMDLRKCSIFRTPLRLPKVVSGGFALTYHLQLGTAQWAVRCFHKEVRDLQARYAAISQTVRCDSDIFVPIDYLPKGICVNGQWYPITKMPWVEGKSLNQYIEENLAPTVLDSLQRQFRTLIRELQSQGIAHGDLQHGNILVTDAGAIKLVDYDGMYVPTLNGRQASERGHPSYQHPRRASQFDADLDRFSSLVIMTALFALQVDPSLWASYSNGDNLLFTQADFLDPSRSSLFQRLRSEQRARRLAERLQRVCEASYSSIPTLDQFLSGEFSSARVTGADGAPRAWQLFPVVLATRRDDLLAHEGDVVRLVGKIWNIRKGITKHGANYAFLNFGGQPGDFTLILWSEVLDLFDGLGRSVDDYNRQWVSVTGLVNTYQSTWGRGAKQPQIVIDMPSEIQQLTEPEANQILGENTGGAQPDGRVSPKGGVTARTPPPIATTRVVPGRASSEDNSDLVSLMEMFYGR